MAFYTSSQRDIQKRFDTQPLADAMEAGIVGTEIDDAHAAFISSRDFFFLSTVSGNGEPTVSFKGGDVGTVKILDNKSLAFPAYDGNGMFLSLGNIEDTAKIGLLFIDFETPHRVRVQATAKLSADDPLLSDYPGAIGIVKAEVTSALRPHLTYPMQRESSPMPCGSESSTCNSTCQGETRAKRNKKAALFPNKTIARR